MADAETKTKQLKVVKKENVEVEEKKPLANGGTKGSVSKTVKVKKEEKTSDSLDNGKVRKKIKTNTMVKEEVVQKKISQDGKGNQREKKIYELPGQKHDPPAERDPLRIFYESLYDQMPTSEMAAFWMLERGLLPKEVAREVYEKKMKKSGQKVGTPVKSVMVKKSVRSIEKKTTISKTVPKKDRKADSSDSDDDFIMSRVKKAKTDPKETIELSSLMHVPPTNVLFTKRNEILGSHYQVRVALTRVFPAPGGRIDLKSQSIESHACISSPKPNPISSTYRSNSMSLRYRPPLSYSSGMFGSKYFYNQLISFFPNSASPFCYARPITHMKIVDIKTFH